MSKKPQIPQLYIKVDLGDQTWIGPDKIQLLKFIRERNSISGAARAMGMSYRRAWLHVEETNKIFGSPVISTHVGGRGHGGARLTQLGERVVSLYETIKTKSEAAAKTELKALAACITTSVRGGPETVETV